MALRAVSANVAIALRKVALPGLRMRVLAANPQQLYPLYAKWFRVWGLGLNPKAQTLSIASTPTTYMLNPKAQTLSIASLLATRGNQIQEFGG